MCFLHFWLRCVPFEFMDADKRIIGGCVRTFLFKLHWIADSFIDSKIVPYGKTHIHRPIKFSEAKIAGLGSQQFRNQGLTVQPIRQSFDLSWNVAWPFHSELLDSRQSAHVKLNRVLLAHKGL